MSNGLLRKSKIIKSQLKTDLNDFKVGSLISVYYKIKEGNKERIQVFSGLVTNRRGGQSIDASFTVIKNSINGIKVERTFPLHSPNIDKIEVDNFRRARRSNLSELAFASKDLAKTGRYKNVKVIVNPKIQDDIEVVETKSSKDSKLESKTKQQPTSNIDKSS